MVYTKVIYGQKEWDINMKNTILKTTIVALLSANSLNALSLIEQKEFDLVQSIIPNTKIQKIKHSPLDGVYEAYFKDGNLMYIAPSKRLIIMGEIYTNTGISLTQKNIQIYKKNNDIKTPLEQSIESLKIKSDENKKYFQELVKNGIKVSSTKKDKYTFILIKSPTCPHCIELDKYLKTIPNTTYRYYAPVPQSEKLYSEKYKIKKPKEKLEKQMKLISKRLKGFGVPFALIVDKDFNLVDTIQGFNKEKWNRYLESEK